MRWAPTVLVLMAAGSLAAVAADSQPPTVSAIQAKFVPDEFATHYTIQASDPDHGDTLSATWSLELRVFDPLPAALDPGCRLTAVEPVVEELGTIEAEFIWYHGDQHGCDHTKQGAHGHQGIVTAVVSDGTWTCTAAYAGTETGSGPAPEPFPGRRSRRRPRPSIRARS